MSCGRAVQKDASIERLSALLRRAGNGDQRAFAELHASTRNRLRKTALSVSPSIVDLDDLLQEAYLKIWKHAASFDPERASPITWMCTIMRNTTIDALRLKQVATADLDEALFVPDAGVGIPTRSTTIWFSRSRLVFSTDFHGIAGICSRSPISRVKAG